jgi:hypothetical protein
MKRLFIAAAIAAACVLAPAASAQHVYAAGEPHIVRGEVMPGYDGNTGFEQRPLADVAQLTSAPLAADQRNAGTHVDFTEIVAGLFLALTALVGWMLQRALRFLPSELQSLIHAFRFDETLKNGFNLWAEKRANDIRARGVTVDLRNEAIASMVRHGERYIGNVVDANGGVPALEERALARVDTMIDKLFERWARQKQNLAAVAAPVTMPPSPTERAAPAPAAPAAQAAS